MTDTIPMEGATKRFYQGVASASEVIEAHAGSEFPDDQARVALFWFYVGAMAAGEHGCETAEDFTPFILGAQTRAPQVETEED